MTARAAIAHDERVLASDPDLVRFDRPTRVFLGALLVLLALATVFKVHGSSIGIWYTRLGATVRLTLIRNDLYEMGLDPKSDLLRRMGARYIVLPGDPEFLAKMVVVESLPRLWIYRYRDDGGALRDPRSS